MVEQPAGVAISTSTPRVSLVSCRRTKPADQKRDIEFSGRAVFIELFLDLCGEFAVGSRMRVRGIRAGRGPFPAW